MIFDIKFLAHSFTERLISSIIHQNATTSEHDVIQRYKYYNTFLIKTGFGYLVTCENVTRKSPSQHM